MTLKHHLIRSLSQEQEPTEPAKLLHRDLVAFAPRSTLGLMHLKNLIASGARFVLAIDDYCDLGFIEGVKTITSSEFLEHKVKFKNLIAVDFSQNQYTQSYCVQLAKQAECELHDLLQVLACFDAPSVYQSIREYRKQTISRADDWLALAEKLADNQSRETLYAVLLQRLEYNRQWIKEERLSGRDEYFGMKSETSTFLLGQNEDFVDCGAHRGTVVQKFLQVTDWKYSSIHAFEPDSENYDELIAIVPWKLENFFPHKLAVSNASEILQFNETGTMGSSISESGNTSIQCVRLDEMVQKASFIKMDVEGFEAKSLKGAQRILSNYRPRLAIASYHYATDLLEIVNSINEITPGYHLYLRHHFGYFYDTILYATPRSDWLPASGAA